MTMPMASRVGQSCCSRKRGVAFLQMRRPTNLLLCLHGADRLRCLLQFLIADFFFVCLSLVALVLAVAVQLATSSTVSMNAIMHCIHDFRRSLCPCPSEYHV